MPRFVTPRSQLACALTERQAPAQAPPDSARQMTGNKWGKASTSQGDLAWPALPRERLWPAVDRDRRFLSARWPAHGAASCLDGLPGLDSPRHRHCLREAHRYGRSSCRGCRHRSRFRSAGHRSGVMGITRWSWADCGPPVVILPISERAQLVLLSAGKLCAAALAYLPVESSSRPSCVGASSGNSHRPRNGRSRGGDDAKTCHPCSISVPGPSGVA
jgi:hypothetical protein